MSDAVRLAVKFFEEVKGFKRNAQGKLQTDNNYKRIVRESIDKILAGGMKPSDLEAIIDKYKVVHETPEEAYNIEDILQYLEVDARKGIIRHDPENLLVRGKFYYHPQLQVTPPPPIIELLPDGTFRSSYEEDPTFYLEIKERYVVDDLLDYFYARVGIKRQNRQKDKGALQYVLKSYDLDTILYAIDEASVMYMDVNSAPPKSPLQIQEYIDYGEALLEDRKNTLHMEGLDHVIPRPH